MGIEPKSRDRLYLPVLSRSVYVGTASLLVPDVTVLPPGCIAGTVQVPLIAGGTAPVAVTCRTAIADGSFPGVFTNGAADGHFATAVNIFDVSNCNTPGVIDPTNAVVGQYYRSVGEVDAHGHIRITEGNAYSGDTGRAAIKGRGLYYMVGNGDQGAELKCPPESSRSRLGVILRLSGMAFGAQFQDAAE